MGWDVLGFVEINRDGMWSEVIDIEPLVVERNSSMLSNFFSVRADRRFQPIVETRGFPADVSETTLRAFNGRSVHQGIPTEADKQYPTWVSWKELETIDWEEAPLEVQGTERQPCRSDILNAEWILLFNLMRLLAEHFGSDNVRLITWFDY